MPPTIAELSSTFAALRAQADFADDMVTLHFKNWLALHKRLLLLKLCARHSIYAKLPLRGNVAALKHCVCKPMRECLQTVIAVQRGLEKEAREMKEWERKEKELHERFDKVATDLEMEKLFEECK